MGIKLRSTIHPLEASISNQTLYVYYWDKVIKEIPIDVPKAVTIGKHCNFFHTYLDNVAGFLGSDKDEYRVIIRWNGTVDVLTSNLILLYRGEIDIKQLAVETASTKFAGSISINGRVEPAYLVEFLTGEVFIFADKIPVTLLLDMNSEICQRIYKWVNEHDDVGTMHIKDKTSGGSVLWVNFGEAQDYIIDSYKILKGHGFIGGVSI